MNFWARGNNLAKLDHMICREAGIKIRVHIFGGPHPKNLGGQETCKIRRDFGQLSTLIANISGMDPLTREFSRLMFTHPKATVRAVSDNQ